MTRDIAVLGAGSWGTALAVHLARVGHRVRVWSVEAPIVAEMIERRANAVYLPDITLPEDVLPTTDLAEAVAGVDVVVLAMPSHAMRSVARAMAPLMRAGAIAVSAAKGLEQESLHRMSEVLAQETAARATRSSCCRGRASPSKWRANCRRPCRSPPPICAAAERVQAEFRGQAVPPLRHDRCGGRGDRRRAEERDRHRGRRGRGARARPQRAGGAHHARARRRSRGWRAPRAAGARRWPA